MPPTRPLHEPHKIKTVRLIAFPTLEERKRNLSRAHFNTFNLVPSQVSFDMLSYGTSAMSQDQIAGQLVGDEAYAGARNFDTLVEAVNRVLGHTYVCPTHNSLGAIKLLVTTIIPKGSLVPSNAVGRIDVWTPRAIEIADVRDRYESVFTGNVDLPHLEVLLSERKAAVVLLQSFADGQHPFSLANLRSVRATADRHGLRLVLDVSRVIENAWYLQKHEAGQAERCIAEIVKQIAKTAHVVLLDGAQDPKSNTGGLLATDNPADHEHFMNEVVLYEGLHTYGGMAGRTMEVFARGLSEMCSEDEVQWVMHQTERFTARLREGGVPLERGCDGAYVKADEFLPHVPEFPEQALAVALYQSAAVRTVVPGRKGHDHLLPVQIPRLAMTNWQLDQVADAVISLFRQRDRVAPLDVETDSPWNDQLRFRSVYADLATYEFDCYPFVIHTTEPIGMTTREQREKAVREAGWNTFLLRSADVTIDLLTDSGTTAMSTEQWAAYDGANATPATSEAYLRFVSAMKEIYGYEYILPTHQGRAAEHIQSEVLIKPGQYVPGNMYFTTTKAHQELPGGIFVDVIVDEAHDPQSEFPWKGNVDLRKLDAIVKEHGAEKVAYLSFELSVNMAGGQPVSMDNLREVYAYCRPKGIPVLFDATRAVENAY
ncbi:MAG: tryptophanase, partial [Deltaproteobacteria bacterium]|nr:tryptophanase [Deltaproteobacteria bacterium]